MGIDDFRKKRKIVWEKIYCRGVKPLWRSYCLSRICVEMTLQVTKTRCQLKAENVVDEHHMSGPEGGAKQHYLKSYFSRPEHLRSIVTTAFSKHYLLLKLAAQF
jgi:hypothetical protein